MTITPGTPVTVADFPAWAREPAKIVGWIVTAVAIFGAGVVELLNEFDVVIPEKWRTAARTVSATVAGVVLVAARFQTWMTRNGWGKPGNGKDGVWSPAGAQVLAQDTAIEVAAAKAVDPETHAQ